MFFAIVFYCTRWKSVQDTVRVSRLPAAAAVEPSSLREKSDGSLRNGTNLYFNILIPEADTPDLLSFKTICRLTRSINTMKYTPMKPIYKKLILLATSAMAILATLPAKADYSNSVMALNPVAYWPLNETNLPPDTVGPATALNLGTLGTALNAPFNIVDVVHGYPGALASTTDTADSFNGFNTRAQSTYTADLANAPSFTVEAWLLAHDDGTIWSTTCPLSDVGANSPRTGWLIYMDINNTGQYTFRTYNANGSTPSLSLDIGAAGSIQNEKWYHVVVVVSNAVTVTNVYAYLNGALAAGPTVLPGYVPCDGTTGGFSIGDRSDNAGFNFVGAIDEVAYYTNALDGATVLSHYQAGTNPSPVTAYSTLVQQKNPILYYRMNEVPTPKSSPYILPLPVATNYGSFGSSLNGFYQPGTVPGVAGPTNGAFGANSRACQFTPFGTQSSSENGPGVMCAPYNQSALNLNAVTLLAWIQVPGPNTPGWFQTPVGRGDTSYRIDVDPSGDPHFAANPNGEPVGSVPLSDNLWHLWAGVFDPVAGKDLLYIDGALAAQAAGSSALVNMSTYLMIGGDPQYTDRNFPGNICHVAIFSNALSQAQIQTLYNSVGAPPIVFLPTNQFFLDEGSTGGLAASASGTPPVSFQWYSTDFGTTNLLAGQTSTTLTLTNVSLSQDGLFYFLVASNVQGVASSGVSKLTVLSGPPQITRDLAPFVQVPVGIPVTYSIAATGTEPFHYQWFKNSSAIAGATTRSLTVNALAGSNTYSVTITNVNGPANSAVSTLLGLTSPPPVITFSGNGNGWTVNSNNVALGGFSANVLTLTDGTNGESSSAFFNTPQYVGGFVAFFTYQEANGDNPLADGATFAIQNSAAGVNALGGGGGQLGFGGILNSAAFEMNIYPPSSGGVGIQFATNGLTPTTTPPASPYMSTAPVNIASGNPINVRLFYNQGALAVQLVDTVSNSTYRTTLNVGDIPAAVNGSSALVGFTGATGGLNAIQKISNFRFAYTTPPTLAVNKSGANLLISWPVSVSTLFVLQQSSSVTGPWANVGTTPTIVNGQNQVSVPNSGAHFYRLMLQ
jgi:hypothetical protein